MNLGERGMIKAITAEEAEKTEVHSLFGKLETSESGLSTSEAEQRQSQLGFNEISEKDTSPVVEFLRYFWGPIPWMIEVAAILSLLVRHWADFTIIVVYRHFRMETQRHQVFLNRVKGLINPLAAH